MIVKEVTIPYKMYVLESLIQRLDSNHPKMPTIQWDLNKTLRGHRGEKAVSYYLDFLPDKDYYIFNGLRLPSGKHFFQMDFLLLTTRFALILECKNFFGNLFFDDNFNQLIRTTEDKEEGFTDPISQAKWHKEQLKNWFSGHHFSLPIDYYVVISNPSTIVKTTSQNKQALNKVVHGHSLLEKISAVERSCQKEVMDVKSVRKMCKLLLKDHTPKSFNALESYGLGIEEIKTGVRCPGCGTIPMKRQKCIWICQSCGCRDKNAHVSALNDYFLLIGPTITNRQFREFVHLESDTTAKRLLGALNLPFSGENKGRLYLKPERSLT